MSDIQYIDQVVNPLKIPRSKPIPVMNGAGRYLDTENTNSGKYKKVNYQYNDLQYNSGNQNTQTQLDEYLRRNGTRSAPAVEMRNEVTRIDKQFRDLDYQAGGRFYNNNESVNSGNNVLPVRPFYMMKNSDKMYMK